MTTWARPHFTLPYLASSVDAGGRPGEVALRDGERVMTLTIDGDVDEAVMLLTALTRPGSHAWAGLGRDAPPALVELVTDLDRLGWLREGDPSGLTRRDERVRRLNQLVDRARRWLAAAGPVEPAGGTSDNLATTALATCREVWRRSSPLTHQVLAQVLDGSADANPGWDPVALVVCDPGDVERQVWAALQLVVMGRSEALACRYGRFVPTTLADGPGVDVLVTAERCAEALLEALGEPELHELLSTPGAATRVAPVLFQHRWFATVRYVEAVAGLLRFRLGRSLLELVLQYLREEMGHEVHESHTCNQLGISDEDLTEFGPLACFAAHPELLADAAERRPLSFLLAMTVAEGLPGSGRRLTERLADDGVGASDIHAHDDIDRRLNHEMVTRTMLSQLDWVSGEVARQAIGDLLLIVELAHTGWQMMSRYVAAGLPAQPRPFAMTPDVVARLCRPAGQG